MSDKTRVAIVRPSEHPRIEDAIDEALSLIKADQIINPGDRILLKPNLTLKLKNASTAKDFIRGVSRSLKKYSNNIFLGDSCGRPSTKRALDILQGLSILTAMEQEGVAYVDFEGEPAHEVVNPAATHLKKYYVARAIAEADVVINLPRPKSHIVAGYTGAVKNYYGIIPGGGKALSHQYGNNPGSFAHVLADNFHGLSTTAPKRITIMDARTFMEGVFAPAGGIMRKTDLIVAGTDEVAVDLVMLAIGRSNSREVPHLQCCMERGLGANGLNNIEIVGKSIDAVRFKKKLTVIGPKTAGLVDTFARIFVYKTMRLLPVLRKSHCNSCGDCAQACPAGAVDWRRGQYPVFKRKDCISCHRCITACGEKALKGKPLGLKGYFIRNPDITHDYKEK